MIFEDARDAERLFELRLAAWLPLCRPTAPGVVRRVVPLDLDDPQDRAQVDEAKRSTLKLLAVGGITALAGGGLGGLLRFAQPPPAGVSSYPKVQLMMEDGSPLKASSYPYGPNDVNIHAFNYPLTNEPNLLLDLPGPAPNGVGPNRSLVAYSAICQHLGCVPPYVSYYAPGQCGSYNGGKAILHCVCHGSSYDPAVAASGGGASILSGPTVSPLPQVILQWEQSTDEVYAVSMTGPPVKGHTNTLVGGTSVGSTIGVQPAQTPTQVCPS